LFLFGLCVNGCEAGCVDTSQDSLQAAVCICWGEWTLGEYVLAALHHFPVMLCSSTIWPARNCWEPLWILNPLTCSYCASINLRL